MIQRTEETPGQRRHQDRGDTRTEETPGQRRHQDR